MYVYVRMYVVCMYVHVFTYVCMCLYACVFTYVFMCMYIYSYIPICMSVFLYWVIYGRSIYYVRTLGVTLRNGSQKYF